MPYALQLPENSVAFTDSAGRLTIAGRASLSKIVADLQARIDASAEEVATLSALVAAVAAFQSGELAVGNALTLEGEDGAYYRDRANHTGSQATSTITGLDAALAAKAPLASPNLTTPSLSGLGNYVDDTAASGGGVPVGGVYRNGSVLMIRVT